MTTFTKGDRVALLTSWNNKGAMRVRRGIVHSAGAKVMRIQYEDGEMFKTAFSPENNVVSAWNSLRIVPDASEAELFAEALKDAAEIIHLNIEHCNERIQNNPTAGAAYLDGMRAKRSELEAATPSVEWHDRSR